MRPRSGAWLALAVPSNWASSCAPLSPQFSSTTTPRPSAATSCRLWSRLQECMVRPISSASNTDSGSCTRAATVSLEAHWPLTSARCTPWLGLSLKACAVNSPNDVCKVRVPIFSINDSCRLRCSIKSAMVPIFRPCAWAKTSRSGKRAMVPSSFMISQITEAGEQPAMAARSQPASVWPARISTPPSTACRGKIWPGCTRSSTWAFLATAACTVRARSAAEMPVLTPSAASIETVKAVPFLSPLREAMGGNCRRSQRSRVSVRQIRPRPKRAMKLMASALTWSAASTRSPSFSRSSSSIKMTILPAAMSATMSSTGETSTVMQRLSGCPGACAPRSGRSGRFPS